MYSINVQSAGQGSAYRFLAIFNSIDSGFQLMLHEATVTAYSAVSVASTTPLLLSRITASSGGTLQNDSVVNKFTTSYPDTITEVRTANPTVTAGSKIYAFAPPIQGLTIGALSPVPQPVRFVTELILEPGEGFAFHQDAAGLTGHQYSIYACWTEQPV